MSKTITATAVISAKDSTGSVLDKIASKFRGLEKNAKALEGIKPPKFLGNLEEELRRLKLSEKELQGVRKEMAAFDAQMKGGAFGAMRASHYFRALDDWKTKTVNHWREIKANVDETDRAHKRFFASAGRAALRWGMIAGGVGSGAYAASRIGRAGIEAAAISQRESARDYLAGMSDADSQRIRDEALRISGRFPSVDASTMHERLRDTAMSTRSVDKALELSDVIAQGTTVLQSLKGKDQAIEEGRKFFSALDVLGKNMDPKEVKELFNGYIKALGVEGADMDLGGALTFARQSRAAGGILSNRFLMTTAPGLARDLGDPQLGTALASALSQNIGGRATKASKEAQQEWGLRDKNGRFLDSRLAMTDPDKWAWERLIPALQKKGVDVNDNVKVSEVLSKLFSNRVVGDVFSKLITQREQYQAKAGQYAKAPGLEAAAQLPVKDPFVAYEAVFAQLRNLATQAPVMDAAASGLNKISGSIASLNDAVGQGEFSGFFSWISRTMSEFSDQAAKSISGDIKDAKMIGGAISKVLDWDKAFGVNPKWLGLGGKEGPNKPFVGDLDPMGGDYTRKSFHSKEYWEGLGREGASADSAARLRREKERQFATSPAFAAPGISETMTYGTGVSGDKTVQAQLTGSAEVHGEVRQVIEVNPSQYFEALVQNVQNAIRLSGQFTANGPGSTGKSSPDANAPPHVGSAGNMPL
ncbi:hypothetical protein [Bradyrhizobium liaoningense]|uniref:hypothetical protein n=1 Tax=Bradyrhizobium liaoningense TaxID=43992 RepID=UPI001BA48DE1|nr:hypothetical protein [Bradyrhizobium liaoningense]MBR0907023.1 hypothetical protein [Bradyrhizobium liaoningense]